MNIGFVGLGSMGLPMARNLLRAGHEVVVYNRTTSRCEALRMEGAKVAQSVDEVAREVDVVITMLADDKAVEEVVFGGLGTDTSPARSSLCLALGRGRVHISMSTISVALSRRLMEAHSRLGQDYFSAPVFGRPEAAEAAKLWIVAAGSAELIQRFTPLLQAMGQGVFEVGREPWQANVVKLGGNFMIAAMLETMGEVFALIRKSGVSPGQFLQILNGSLIKSPLYENYGRIVIEERFSPPGFKLRLGLKDARLVLQAADAVAAPMPLASLIHDHLLSAFARGHGEIDWAALARISAENAGLPEAQVPTG